MVHEGDDGPHLKAKPGAVLVQQLHQRVREQCNAGKATQDNGNSRARNACAAGQAPHAGANRHQRERQKGQLMHGCGNSSGL